MTFAETLRRPVARLRRRGREGFTATEMMIVLAIIGIMVLFSIPALIDFFRAMKVRTAAHQLVSRCRLCRQIAVSHRTHVTMVLEGGASLSTYRAWEDVTLDDVRDANGPDDEDGTDDDEPWVVEPVQDLVVNDVFLRDVYNDTSTDTWDDVFGEADSVMSDDDDVYLRFYPDGQVLRIDSEGNEVEGDTLVRIRLDGKVGRDRLDRWYVGLNRPGKVQADFIRDPAWE